jgi:hypothetical protein
MEIAKIISLGIFSAMAYGLLHDQVTARVCLEYFTIGHPPVFATDSPTLLAFGWGIMATWWVGLLLGTAAAMAARLGSWPKCEAVGLIRPVFILLVVTGALSLVAGLCGYFLANAGVVWLVEPLRSLVPKSRHAAFLADLWAHVLMASESWGQQRFVDTCCAVVGG